MRNVTRNFVPLLVLLWAVSILFAPNAQAQYFGQNKVQWENFHFKVLKTNHFDIYYYDREADVVNDIGRMAERWYDRLSATFHHQFGRKPIVLYANPADFQQTTTTPGLIGEGTGGFTDPFQNRIVMPLTGDYAENDHVLGHEMVHVFQFDIANTASTHQRFDIEAMPLWIVEGMAEYFSKGRVDPLTAMWMRDATARKRLPDIRKLTTDPRYFPYRYGQAFLAYIGGKYGDDDVIRFFLAAGSSGGPEQAIERVFGMKAKEFFKQWHASNEEIYQPFLTGASEGLTNPVLTRERTKGDLNIAPSISPDGRKIAFLSTRELFSIDLYVADAATGQVTDKLVSSDTDPHFDALRFIDSAGSWAPDSSKIAFVVYERGDNQLAIVDVNSHQIDRIKVPGVDSMSNPAWSPDGRSVALSGQTSGVTDLFVYNLDTKQVRRLTNDKYADLQPTWSPDGNSIAFVSDRGATDLELLRYEDMKISVIDLPTGNIRTLSLFESGKHMNPQYGPDGQTLYFIANPQGISNIYRYSFANNSIARVTNVMTGVAGITELSPAMSVASKTGQVAFSVYQKDDYDIYELPSNPAAETVSASIGNDVPRAALLPPLQATARTNYTSYLQRPQQGLLKGQTNFPTVGYKPSLHLTYLGPPTIGVGADRYGFGVGGAVSAYFTDVLGQHNLGFTVQTQSTGAGSFADQTGAEVFYLNQQHRFNWGGEGVHIPYVSFDTRFFEDYVTVNGQQVLALIAQQRRDIQTIDELSGITQYPFSLTRRIEAQAGVQRYGFKSEIEQQIIVNDQVIDDSTQRLNSSSLNFVRASTAFVGDSSVFGFISPVKGTRYRYEVEALRGDLNFETLLADWRKYFYFRPTTLAVRALHYGRYGADAENEQISPLYVGQPTLVRGYEIDSIHSSECGPSGTQTCPVFDRLVGSRIGVASVEWRVPLFGVRQFGVVSGAFLPTELELFADAGTAWNANESPKFKYATNTAERVPVFSAGIGARILLSYIPVQLYYAKPFQRPDEGWVFGWTLAPGW